MCKTIQGEMEERLIFAGVCHCVYVVVLGEGAVRARLSGVDGVGRTSLR